MIEISWEILQYKTCCRSRWHPHWLLSQYSHLQIHRQDICQIHYHTFWPPALCWSHHLNIIILMYIFIFDLFNGSSSNEKVLNQLKVSESVMKHWCPGKILKNKLNLVVIWNCPLFSLIQFKLFLKTNNNQ